MLTHICDNGHTQMSHISDDLTVLRWNLCMLDQLIQVLLCDPCMTTQTQYIIALNYKGPPGPLIFIFHTVSNLLLTILEENVKKNDAYLVVGTDVGIQQNGYDGPHGIFNLLSLCICSHGQILHSKRRLWVKCITSWKEMHKCMACLKFSQSR